jgi:sporadic carbohydrate cluster 2OG-Fe(II) oxygenase
VLPVHADTWSGDSPFEVVLWIPFVDVSKTKSMFVLPMDKNEEHLLILEKKTISKTSEIMDQILPDVQWLDLKFGEIVVFTQNIMHGNVVNGETSSRWSTNCRFKSAFSPYADKKIGEFFDPITLRPATLLGSRYKLPHF